jgi:hypothetical protein
MLLVLFEPQLETIFNLQLSTLLYLDLKGDASILFDIHV